LVSLGATVHDALAAMTSKRSGACLVLDQKDQLAGIFTHGDFVRAFQKDPLLGLQQVAAFMTKEPITLSANSLAAEAVATIGGNQIDDVVVLDELGKPIGMVDSQDFARHRLI
jgi:arabinose-5-phosphate isomerase